MMIWLQYEYARAEKSGIARETVPIIHGDTGHFAGQSGQRLVQVLFNPQYS